ncbi:MAG: hypothetical protein V5A56_15105 [Halolamina sp.]
MREPPEKATAADDEEPPDFEALEDPGDLLEGERTRDDFLSVALQLREPTPIAEIAELAGRGADSAREYMRWFETIGLVRRASDDPEQYETNQSFLYWRRLDRIRSTYRDAEIVERLQEVLDELDGFRERYGASRPTEVDIVSTAEAREADVEAVWEDISRWKTLLARRNLLEDALDRGQDRYLDASGDSDGDSKRKRPA